jgi:hypothetical protein
MVMNVQHSNPFSELIPVDPKGASVQDGAWHKAAQKGYA